MKYQNQAARVGIDPGVAGPGSEWCSTDNLLIGGVGSVVEYPPPFTVTSARVVTLAIPGSVQAP